MKRLGLICIALSAALFRAHAADFLEAGFKAPPASAKPHTWFHMMNGNVTKDGITRDFEALAKVGIGGVQMFDAGCEIPPGGLNFNSPEWFDMFQHAASEAHRLGLEICIPNCSGWSSSGGPWNPPSNGMKRVTFSQTNVAGPQKLVLKLPRETNDHGYYADIGVFAFPTPAAESAAFPTVQAALAPDGQSFVLSSPTPFTAAGISYCLNYKYEGWHVDANLTIETSDDGVTFKPLETYHEVLVRYRSIDEALLGPRVHTFAHKLTIKALRVKLTSPELKVTFSSPHPTACVKLSNLMAKTFAFREYAEEDVPRDKTPTTPDQIVPQSAVLDLSSHLAADGTFTWNAPAGNWTILRIGAICTGTVNHPASDHGVGLEVDKLSAAALDFHFEQYVARLCRTLGPNLAGNVAAGFNNVLVDSYEIGSQNWTQQMEEEFLRRRGYSLRPFLPIFAGFIINDVETTERFLEDFRRVVADLFAENYAGALAKKCREYGLKLSLEPYGNCPSDNLQYGEYCDIPMGEFWRHWASPFNTRSENVNFAAFIAHVWGKPIVGAEAFTSRPTETTGRWLTTPAALKAQSDGAYANGVNRIIYHRFVHQPWANDKYLPGMTMGKWGMHLDRTQTWWDFAAPWFTYQARCQFMLQQGTPCADVLYFAGEQAPNQGGNTNGPNLDKLDVFHSLPFGYKYDICPTDAMYLLKVDPEGRIVVPGGVRYRLLAIPPLDAMTPEMLTQIINLHTQGATIVWPQKPTRTPGLKYGPHGDETIRNLASTLRGTFTNSPSAALSAYHIAPDLTIENNPTQTPIQWTHRSNATSDWYFIAAPLPTESTLTLSFRQIGRIPELWDAETATCTPATTWYEKNGRTFVDIPLSICGSKFVVFRRAQTSQTAQPSVPPKLVPLTDAWTVKFPSRFLPNKMATKQEAEILTFEKLISWSESTNANIRYFSGTATYEKQIPAEIFSASSRVELDLGNVQNFAEVTANGQLLATLWKPPFRVDLTPALSQNAPLNLRIRVTNLWPNRIIGDDIQFAEDCTWRGQAIREIPQWVKSGQPSPTGRHTFTTWKHWTKSDALLPSGLLGPTTLRLW